MFKLLILLLFHLNPAKAQNCNAAPDEGTRIICQQIVAWDKNARTSSAVAPFVQAPGASGPQISPLAVPNTPDTIYDCMDIPCICGFLQGTMNGNICVLSNGRTYGKALRKEYRMMTDQERSAYHTAMWTIKASGEYDSLSRIHSQFSTSGGAHSGPAFLCWHREYIKRMEIALRRVDPSVALPYWDSVMDGALPNPLLSIMWSNELMGTTDSNSYVTSGVFRNWMTDDGSRVIRRMVGAQARPFSEADVTAALAAANIVQTLAFTAPQPSCSNPAGWNALEYSHGNPHVYVGGDMLITTNSSQDPIFFQHHSWIDFVWEMWRLSKQSYNVRPVVYPPDDPNCCSQLHYAQHPMVPFTNFVNMDGLSNGYTDNLYSYAPRATCTRTQTSCGGSKYLFCDISRSSTPRCVAKMVLGAACVGYFNGEQPCYLGQCINGICQVTVTLPPTTTAPIITTSPVTNTTVETCYNSHECCGPWASRGECQRNPAYMNLYCPASCVLCIPKYDLSIECSNRGGARCPGWAASGECTANPLWMRENCRLSCNRCSQTRSQICYPGATTTTVPTTTTTPPRPTSCWDFHYCCQVWRNSGYCTDQRYIQYMRQSCQVSCNFCGSNTPDPQWNGSICRNFHPSCASWAASGECTRNPSYMRENCKVSCNACALVNYNNRVVACRANTVRAVSKAKSAASKTSSSDNPRPPPGIRERGPPATVRGKKLGKKVGKEINPKQSGKKPLFKPIVTPKPIVRPRSQIAKPKSLMCRPATYQKAPSKAPPKNVFG